MPLTDPVPSSAFDVLERNIQDTDKFVNQETGTFTNRVGKTVKPIPVIEAEANAAVISLGWSPVGEFATGFTYTKLNDVGRDASGSWWRYNGSDLPKIITAGTVPSSPNFSVISFETADNVQWEIGKSVGYSLDDHEGFKQALLSEAGIVDDGLPDTVGNSQRVDAIVNLFKTRGVTVFSSVSNMTNNGAVDGTGITVGGKPVTYYVPMKITLQGENGRFVLYDVNVAQIGEDDINLGGGFWARALALDSEYVEHSGESLSDILKKMNSLDRFLRYARTNGDLKSHPIYLVGDSISEGSNSSNFAESSYAALIRKSLNKSAGHRNYGFANFDFDVAQAQTDPHTLNRSGFAGSSFNDAYFGGVMLQSAGAGEYIDIQYTGKDFFVVYGQQAGGGLIDVTIDGVSVGTIDTSVVAGQQIAGNVASGNGTFSGNIVVSKWGDHTVRLTANSALPVRLIGMCYYEDVATTLHLPTLFNVGRSSITLSDIADDVLQAYASSGTLILSLGVNDDLLSKPIATFKAKLDTIFTAINAVDGGVIATDFIFSKPSTNIYKTALREKCAEYDIPLLDFALLWFGDATVNKFVNLLADDNVHPTDGGHINIAQTLANKIRLPFSSVDNPKRLVMYVSAGFNPLAGYEPLTSITVNGITQVNGSVTNSTGAIVPENTLIATLAVGSRVKDTILMIAPTASGFTRLEVRNNGGIYTSFGSTIAMGDWIGLTMSFITDET